MPVGSRILLLTLIPLAAYAQAPPSVPLLKTGTQLVTVDVVVTDSNQNPVHNLSAADFTVLEDNKPQIIKSFEEHALAAPTKAEPPLILPPGNFTNYTDAPSGAPLNILLLDTLNTPLEDQTYVHNQIRLFLKNSPPNAPLAIFGLGSHLYLLQPFTADPQLLRSAIETKSLKNSPLLESKARGDGSNSLSEKMMEGAGSSDLNQCQSCMRMKQFEADHNAAASQLRARYTLEALNQIARYLAGMPGKKNLIWFSGSFPINVLPESSLLGPYSDPFSPVAGSADLFRETTRMLAQSQVAVFPVGASSLSVSSVYSAEESGLQYNTYTRPLDTFATNIGHASAVNADNNITMVQMADQTGSHAFINTNGLAAAITQVIATGSDFYTLTYTPSTAVTDGKFRKIQVKLRQDFTLAYRRGYYADAPKATDPALAAQTDPMQDAMVYGSPMPTQIILKVLVVPAAGAPETELPRSNYSPALAKLNGPFRRYDVTIAADPGNIAFSPTADGRRRVYLQFRTYLYDEHGKLVNTSSRIEDADLTPALYAGVMHSAVFLHQEIGVPMKGSYYLRIGVHDVAADRDGAVEVPVASVKDLPPAVAAPEVKTLTPRH